jgi:hypothetical protein
VTRLDALQATLGGEHAAVFVIGYLGAQTSQSANPQLYAAFREAYAVHRARRDEVVGLVRAAGGDPVAAEPSYDLPPAEPGDAGSLAAAGLAVERACGVTYGYLVASSASEDRAWAVDAVLDSALRELTFGGPPRDFPAR